MRLTYAIKFVEDMDTAVAFYRDRLGLPLGFSSPFWSEFETGDTKLALHPASVENPAGTVQLGLGTDHVDRFFEQGREAGMTFTREPTDMHGTRIARFLDCENSEISVSGGDSLQSFADFFLLGAQASQTSDYVGIIPLLPIETNSGA